MKGPINLFPFRQKVQNPKSVNLNKSIINITKAVLYDDDGDVVLERNFAPITMINGDSLEMKWTLTSNGNHGITPIRKVDLNEWPGSVVDPDFPMSGLDDPEWDEAINKWYERL